jgi:hypothetical protein
MEFSFKSLEVIFSGTARSSFKGVVSNERPHPLGGGMNFYWLIVKIVVSTDKKSFSRACLMVYWNK